MDESESPPLAVGLLALPETTPTTLFGFLEVFSAVGSAWTQLTGEASDSRRIATRIVARDTRPFASPVGPTIAPDACIDDVAQCDVVLVTDLALASGVPSQARWGHEAAWLQRQFRGGALIGSVCTGSLFLAAAGLLDGEDATTHWGAIDLFRDRFPAVRLHPEQILCRTGPEQRLVTSGGAGSWEDLALYVIARYCGVTEAGRIARVFVLGDRSDGQLVFSAMSRPREHDDAVIAESQQWIAGHYDVAYPVGRMIERSGLAARSFKRRFKIATGYAPIAYVQSLRVEEAKQMLESTSQSVDEIAQAVGYEDPAYFRRLFKRKTGVTPSSYRRRFQSAVYLRKN